MATPHSHVMFPIYGLTCGGGGAAEVERALLRVPGVRRAYVNPLTAMAYVQLDQNGADDARLAAALHEVGCEAGAVQAH